MNGVQGEGKIYFLSPQMDIFKSNKAVLDFINSHSEMFSHTYHNMLGTDENKIGKIEKRNITFTLTSLFYLSTNYYYTFRINDKYLG